MTENIKYGLALKVLREARGLSAQELSTSAGLAGYTISRIETGKLGLDFSTAVLLAEKLGITLDAIVATAATLPQNLVEQEVDIEKRRKEIKALRRSSRDIRQGLSS